MTNTKNTKRALLASALSMLLCISMLATSTFAWFTDSASTAVNTIQSGKLEVALEMLVNGQWVDAEGKTLGFVDDEGNVLENILWEPGCSYLLQPFRIVNKGNLALKFDFVVSGISGDVKLADAIEYGLLLGDVNNLSFVSMGNLNDFDSIFDAVEEANLAVLNPGETFDTSEDGITFHMKEDAGNEYQDLELTGMSITVLATQLTSEEDSYDDQYDKDAAYLAAQPTVFESGTNSVDLSATRYEFTSGGDFTGAIVAKGGTLNIAGEGEVELTAAPNTPCCAVISRDEAVVNIESGTFVLERADKESNETYDLIYARDGAVINITGGIFKSDCSARTLNVQNQSNGKIIVSGGTFWEFNPSQPEADDVNNILIAEGYKVISEDKPDGTWYTVVAE